MTIYIYGSKDFTESIHTLFEHTNIKLRLNNEDSIVDIKSLSRLKNEIKENSDNIFLIDDDKIIKKGSLSEKINLFKAKDRIEEEFLKEHGVGDLNVDSFDDIAKYVIKKLEEEHLRLEEAGEEIDEEVFEDEQSNSIGNDYDLDDIEEFDYMKKKKFSDFNVEFSSIDTNDTSLSSLNNDLDDEEFDLVIEEIEKKGNNIVNDEFSELDSLSENDLLEALGGGSNKSINITPKVSNEVELNSSNVNDIATLITQLLNNKTLEITIKIKE